MLWRWGHAWIEAISDPGHGRFLLPIAGAFVHRLLGSEKSARSHPRGLERGMQSTTIMTTIGQLIADVYSKYERHYHHEQLAAVATQVTVDEILRARRLVAKRAHPTPAAHTRKAA